MYLQVIFVDQAQAFTSFVVRWYSSYTVDTTRINPFSTYVCTERIFDSPQFVRNKIFLKII